MSVTEPNPVLIEAGARPNLWRVGTLVYTLPALSFLFFWLLWGDFTLSFKDRAAIPTLNVLLRDHHSSATFSGVMQSVLPPLIAILFVPIISYRSDRHRGRRGRRIPFLLIPTMLAAVATIALGYSPSMGSALYRLLGPSGRSEEGCILLVIGLAWTFFEIASITSGAVFGWLIADVVPRSVMGRFFGMFRALSLIAGMLFMKLVFGFVAVHYRMIFLLIGALYGVSFALMCFKVKEGEYPPPDDPASDPSALARCTSAACQSLIPLGADVCPACGAPVIPIVGSVQPSSRRGPFRGLLNALRTYLRDCFKNPYYLWYFLSLMLAHMAFVPINNYSVPFATSLGMSDTIYGHYSFVQYGCSLALALPLGWLADKLHPLRVTIMALTLYAAATILAFFFVRTAGTFAAAHVICGACSGIWLTTTAPLGPALLPKSKFATYSSGAGIFGASGIIVAGLIPGRVLDHLNAGLDIKHYDFHYIYLWASTFMILSLSVTLVVYKKFMGYGGPKHYAAPD